MSEGKVIQWFPGHMAKAKREITESLAKVDVIFELYDARIPFSSKNPMVDEIVKNKPRVVLLNKAKIADPKVTKQWIDYYAKKGILALDIDSITGYNINKITQYAKMALKDLFLKREKRGIMSKTIKAMIIGIPNVGKSTLINKLANRKATQVGDKPGVTKSQTWIKVTDDMFLLDTPGILWPKFESEEVGIKLAICQGIKDEIVDKYKMAVYGLVYLAQKYPSRLKERYNLDDLDTSDEGLHLIEEIARKRGFIQKGARIDYERTITYVLNDIRSNKLGAISFEESE